MTSMLQLVGTVHMLHPDYPCHPADYMQQQDKQRGHRVSCHDMGEGRHKEQVPLDEG